MKHGIEENEVFIPNKNRVVTKIILPFTFHEQKENLSTSQFVNQVVDQ